MGAYNFEDLFLEGTPVKKVTPKPALKVAAKVTIKSATKPVAKPVIKATAPKPQVVAKPVAARPVPAKPLALAAKLSAPKPPVVKPAAAKPVAPKPLVAAPKVLPKAIPKVATAKPVAKSGVSRSTSALSSAPKPAASAPGRTTMASFSLNASASTKKPVKAKVAVKAPKPAVKLAAKAPTATAKVSAATKLSLPKLAIAPKASVSATAPKLSLTAPKISASVLKPKVTLNALTGSATLQAKPSFNITKPAVMSAVQGSVATKMGVKLAESVAKKLPAHFMPKVATALDLAKAEKAITPYASSCSCAAKPVLAKVSEKLQCKGYPEDAGIKLFSGLHDMNVRLERDAVQRLATHEHVTLTKQHEFEHKVLAKLALLSRCLPACHPTRTRAHLAILKRV